MCIYITGINKAYFIKEEGTFLEIFGFKHFKIKGPISD